MRVQADEEPLRELMTKVLWSALDMTWIRLSSSLTHCIPINLRRSGRPLTVAVKGMVQSVGLDVNPRTCCPFLSLTTLRKRVSCANCTIVPDGMLSMAIISLQVMTMNG